MIDHRMRIFQPGQSYENNKYSLYTPGQFQPSRLRFKRWRQSGQESSVIRQSQFGSKFQRFQSGLQLKLQRIQLKHLLPELQH